MKRTLIFSLLMLFVASVCVAEADPQPIYDFSAQYGADESVKKIYEGAINGGFPNWRAFWDWITSQLADPFHHTLTAAYSSIGTVFMLALLRGSLPKPTGSGDSACFLLRLVLMLSFSEIAVMALTECETCLHAVAQFASAAAPGIAALLASVGMTGTSALVSPAAALAGGIAEDIFLNLGFPLCKSALALAIAGNLSETVNLNRFVSLLKKIANWGTGLITAIFTALTALQGGASEVFDGVGIRTAKFAVDNAAPIIGSGVSDVWESFVSGMMITKNALGMSGIAALLAAGIKPVVSCTAAMLMLNILAALLELFGEKETACASAQIGGICQMALSLSVGALVIGTVLMGAAMALGRGILA